jgi:hypothetical protein
VLGDAWLLSEDVALGRKKVLLNLVRDDQVGVLDDDHRDDEREETDGRHDGV